jgi:hypothetical protein
MQFINFFFTKIFYFDQSLFKNVQIMIFIPTKLLRYNHNRMLFGVTLLWNYKQSLNMIKIGADQG